VVPELAEQPDAWFLLCTTKPLKPLIYQNRKEAKFVAMDRDTDENVFMRKQFLYGVDGRSNAGFGFWQMAYGSTGEVDDTPPVTPPTNP
ncbi:Mu-like prophage major head subunit gpT family protein, partial [Paenibacillus alvei]